MRTPSPNFGSSRSSAAAALLESSQTPPQRTPSAHVSMEMSSPLGRDAMASPLPAGCFPHAPEISNSDQSESIANDFATDTTDRAAYDEQHHLSISAEPIIQRATPSTPRRLVPRLYVISSPELDSVRVCKVSSSDEEDMDMHAHGNYYSEIADYTETPQIAHAAAPECGKTVGHTSPSTAVESEYEMRYIGIAGSPSAQQISQPASLSEQRGQTMQPVLTIGSDELQSYLQHTSPFSQQEHRAITNASTPPQQTVLSLPPSKNPIAGSDSVSQEFSHARDTLSPADFDVSLSQQVFQSTPSVGEPSTPGYWGLFVPDQASTRGVEACEGNQTSAALPEQVPEPTRLPQETRATNAPRDGFGPKPFDVRDLTYRTIKSIKMPVRGDLEPGHIPPEPAPNGRPYGDDIDYRASMLIWWCDDLELSYSETMRRYRLKFPEERTITEDTVRKRHIVYIERLARRYGLKPQDELKEPGAWVARRGRQTGHKYNTINGASVYSASAGQDVARNIRRRRIRAEPTQHRGFLKACICVWKDTANVSFEQIKQRLQNEYSWTIGANTVQKLYYAERARVYDTHEEIIDIMEGPAPIRTPDEDLNQLKAHFKQRQAYLLRPGQHVIAQDVEYMQQLQRLIDSLEQDRLRRAQLMGRGPTEMVHCTANEAMNANVTMLDAENADPGNEGFRGVV